MPTGIPKSGKRQRRIGYTLPPGPPSTQTQRLLEALHDIEQRLAVQRAKDKARNGLLKYAAKYDLTAQDLRDAAKQLDRTKGDGTSVVSRNLTKAQRLHLGRQLRKAREAKGLHGTELGKMVGAKGTAAVAQWERGMLPTLPKYRTALVKTLDLPADFFDGVKSARVNGTGARA